MSFSISFNIGPFADSKEFVTAAQAAALVPSETGTVATTPMANQLANGTGVEFLQAVEQGALCAWGACQAIAGNALEVSVSISGHVNPDNDKTDGWANDSMHISVTVKEYWAQPEPIPSADTVVQIPAVTVA